ncbi:MAG TPA: TetR/AcrR family transcriptional regulator [Saprospiraceae bacterium]|nr:TetR/AcrR family transcriptional regulator [Saprospiraceae bacterium]HMQ82560.1 TetR/AcrR family transcriptional regulator [Saprospiraceae bacterium]
MKGTKDKILTAALKLFNRDGIVNVRLQHIADEAFISIGNLAYHFANKEAIVQELYETLTGEQKELLKEYRVVPLFEYLHRLIQRTYQFQNKYLFFYIDTLEITRAYPDIGQAHQQHILFQMEQLQLMLDFNVSRGVLQPKSTDRDYGQIALQVWMTLDFWLFQSLIRIGRLPEEADYQHAFWALLKPHLTDMGRQEFRQISTLPFDLLF